MFRVNAWAVVVLLVVGSCINWDVSIAKYNINNRDKITLDTLFVYTLSDRTLPILNEHKELFATMPAEYRLPSLQQKVDGYMKNQQKYTWLSWNYADDKVKRYFDKQNDKTVLK